MRQRFQQQTTLGITPINEVKFPLCSRDKLPPVLMALQHIFLTPQLNEQVFDLLEKKVVSNKKKTGRNTLQQDYTQQAVLPKRGRFSKEDKERESAKTFKQLRNAHSAIESNINMLEHHGIIPFIH